MLLSSIYWVILCLLSCWSCVLRCLPGPAPAASQAQMWGKQPTETGGTWDPVLHGWYVPREAGVAQGKPEHKLGCCTMGWQACSAEALYLWWPATAPYLDPKCVLWPLLLLQWPASVIKLWAVLEDWDRQFGCALHTSTFQRGPLEGGVGVDLILASWLRRLLLQAPQRNTHSPCVLGKQSFLPANTEDQNQF